MGDEGVERLEDGFSLAGGAVRDATGSLRRDAKRGERSHCRQVFCTFGFDEGESFWAVPRGFTEVVGLLKHEAAEVESGARGEVSTMVLTRSMPNCSRPRWASRIPFVTRRRRAPGSKA